MGPDRVPPLLLKECKNELAPAILIMWRRSLDTGEIPKIYLQQSIIPIYKKSGRARAANYRPFIPWGLDVAQEGRAVPPPHGHDLLVAVACGRHAGGNTTPEAVLID